MSEQTEETTGDTCPAVPPLLYPLLVDRKRPRAQSAPPPPIPTTLSSKYPSATLLAVPSFPRERPAASENWIGSDSKCGRSIQKRFIERGLRQSTRDIYRYSIDKAYPTIVLFNTNYSHIFFLKGNIYKNYD